LPVLVPYFFNLQEKKKGTEGRNGLMKANTTEDSKKYEIKEL
jgi:hypothetical protein